MIFLCDWLKALLGDMYSEDLDNKIMSEIDRITRGLKSEIAERDKQIAASKLDSLLEARLLKEGAVNSKAVRALLDCSKLSLDGVNIIGLDEQLKAIRESEKWAFAPPSIPGSGGNPPPAPDGRQLPSGTVIF